MKKKRHSKGVNVTFDDKINLIEHKTGSNRESEDESNITSIPNEVESER